MNRNRILIARGATGALVASEEVIPYGQPVYDREKNYLVIGTNETKKYRQREPITVRKLVGYFDDNDQLTSGKTMRYSVEPTANELKVVSSKNLVLSSNGADKIDISSSISLKVDTNVTNLSVNKLLAKSGDTLTIDHKKVTLKNVDQKGNLAFTQGYGVQGKFIVHGGTPTTPWLTVTENKVEVATAVVTTLNSSTISATASVTSPTIDGTTEIKSPVIKVSTGDNKLDSAGLSVNKVNAETGSFSGNVDFNSTTKFNGTATFGDAKVNGTLTVTNLVIN